MNAEENDFVQTDLQYLSDYFSSLINIFENPIGVQIRKCVVERIKTAVPGKATMIAWHDYGSFQSLFYPKADYGPDQTTLDTVTGITGNTWADISIPFVCDVIYNVTKDLREYVNISKVRADEKSIIEMLGEHSAALYQHFLKTGSNPTAIAYKKLSEEQKINAKNDYISIITKDAWVENKKTAYNTGNWKDCEWELYHHWNKMMILGATQAEVDEVIDRLSAKGLHVDSTVKAKDWLKYAGWVGSELTWSDFSEARDTMNARTMVGQIQCKEIYSGLFLDASNPGSPYWQKPPEVSCFSKETLVLMADGSLREISAIKRGDRVMSSNGARRVMLVSIPLRGDRVLYAFKGRTFKFSGTHPFKVDGGYACAEPESLCSFIPTFDSKNTRSLYEKVSLKTPHAMEICADLTVNHPYADTGTREMLYDLILEPDENGVFNEYYVGDEKSQYLVASEIPTVEGRAREGYAFLKMVSIMARPVLIASRHISDSDFWAYIQKKLHHCAFGELLPRFAVEENKIERKTTPTKVDGLLFSQFADMFDDESMNIRVGLLFSATFQILLPIFLQNPISAEAAERMGHIIAEILCRDDTTQTLPT